MPRLMPELSADPADPGDPIAGGGAQRLVPTAWVNTLWVARTTRPNPWWISSSKRGSRPFPFRLVEITILMCRRVRPRIFARSFSLPHPRPFPGIAWITRPSREAFLGYLNKAIIALLKFVQSVFSSWRCSGGRGPDDDDGDGLPGRPWGSGR